MSLKERIGEDLKAAMKGHEDLKVSVLRLLLSAISYKAIDSAKQNDGSRGELSDEEVEGVIGSEVKKRRESVAAYRGKRDDLADKEQAELEILEAYLPEGLSEEEIRQVVQEVISGLSEEEKINVGRAVGAVMGRLKGKRVDGSRVKEMVEESLKN